MFQLLQKGYFFYKNKFKIDKKKIKFNTKNMFSQFKFLDTIKIQI
jgi:hypothetical protein